MTTTEYKRLRERAEASRRSRRALAARLAMQAGIDPSAPWHSAHNALVARNRGQPWSGVDYSLVRRVNSIDAYAAGRIVDRIVMRSPLVN
jgi:hypothetical protein